MYSSAWAVGWFDDFNDGNVTDGNPVTWSQNLMGGFPGVYDASSGDYRLSAPGGGANDQLVTWVNDVPFTDTYIRTQGVVEPADGEGKLVILGRVNPDIVSAYVLYLGSDGDFVIQSIIFGDAIDLAGVTLTDMDNRTDVIMELDMIGTQLNGFAWRPGQPKPAVPQVSVTSDILSMGSAGIAYEEDNADSIAVYRFAAAQDMPFLDGIPGDYNANGVVDAADYVLWRSGGPLANEVHNPGTVSQEDYAEWRARFGNTSGSGNAALLNAVPEPTGLLLALASSLACLFRATRL
jgi:hypothetical protein